MRKIVVAIGAIVLLIVLALAIFVATFNPNRYRQTIAAQIARRLGRNVTLGDMRLKVFPLRFQVQDMTIADDPNFNPRLPFVHAPGVDLSVELFPLMSGAVKINSLSLRQPSVELIRNRAGVWNFSSLGGQRTSDSAQTPFSLSKLGIDDGQVALTDLQNGKGRSVYDHIEMTVRDFAMDRPFSLDVAARLPGQGNQELNLEGKAGPIVRGQPASTQFEGTLDLKQAGLANLRQFLNSAALKDTDGALSGQTKITSQAGNLSATGQLNIANARVNDRDLGYPISADYRLNVNNTAELLTIQQSTIKLGTTPLLISGTVNSKPAPALININVKANDVSMIEAAKLAAASGVGFAPGTTVTGIVSADVQAKGAANNPALTGSLNGRDIQVSGKDIPQPVQMHAIKLTFTPTQIDSDDFTLTSGGASAAVQFSLHDYLLPSRAIDATVRVNNAPLPAVLSMAKAYGVTSLNRISGGGSLSLDMCAAGPLQSVASAAVTRILNGAVTLNLAEVRYTGYDINHQLGALGGLLGVGSTKDQGSTTIHRITGNIAIKSGVARTNNLKALLDLGNAAIAGTANLVDETLNLRVTAVLSKDMSQKVGGAGVGGYLQTVLPNNVGELVIPATVTGTFQNPKFSPDMQQIAQMKLKGVVPSFDDPQSAVSGIVGGLLGGQTSTSPEHKQPAPQTQDPLNQLQNLFGTKKKPPPK